MRLLVAVLEGKTDLTPRLAGQVIGALKERPEKAGDLSASLTPRRRDVLIRYGLVEL